MDTHESLASRNILQGKGLYLALAGAVLFFLSCMALLAAAYIFFIANKQVPAATAPTDTDAVLLQVDNLVNLPNGERPQVIPITDLTQFSQQKFFDRGRVGDVLVVYIENHLAILYDPTLHKIVNMSKISVLLPNPAALP